MGQENATIGNPSSHLIFIIVFIDFYLPLPELWNRNKVLVDGFASLRKFLFPTKRRPAVRSKYDSTA